MSCSAPSISLAIWKLLPFSHSWTQSVKHVTLLPCVNHIMQGLSELWCTSKRESLPSLSLLAIMKTTCVLRGFFLASPAAGSYFPSQPPPSLRKKIHRKKCIQMHISHFMPVSLPGLSSQWLRELVRQTTQDRWEVTRVSRGCDARLQTHCTSAVLCVVACVTARVCNSTDKKYHVNMIPLRSGVTLLTRNTRGNVSQTCCRRGAFVADTLSRGMCVCWVM